MKGMGSAYLMDMEYFSQGCGKRVLKVEWVEHCEYCEYTKCHLIV